MNREIRFRAWDKFNKMMHYLPKNIAKIQVLNPKTLMTTPKAHMVTDVMQFTGLKDKNGKDIYEGDIVENHLIRGKVVFKNGSYWLKRGNGFYCLRYNKLAVIGNVWENPDLLPNTKEKE